jgi:hypothetical protein
MSITKFFALMRAVDEHHLVCFVCTPMSHAVVVAPDGVYTDGVHMQSWNVSVLHTFAQKMGLKRDWFQEEGVRFRGRGAEDGGDIPKNANTLKTYTLFPPEITTEPITTHENQTPRTLLNHDDRLRLRRKWLQFLSPSS